MTKLDPDDGYAVLINTFEVEPDHVDELIAILQEATEGVMRNVPGFKSANLHVSDDRTRVVNYAQWESRDAFAKMKDFPGAGEHMGKAASIAMSFNPVIYSLRFSDSKR